MHNNNYKYKYQNNILRPPYTEGILWNTSTTFTCGLAPSIPRLVHRFAIIGIAVEYKIRGTRSRFNLFIDVALSLSSPYISHSLALISFSPCLKVFCACNIVCWMISIPSIFLHFRLSLKPCSQIWLGQWWQRCTTSV